jgi:hypothetical protein
MQTSEKSVIECTQQLVDLLVNQVGYKIKLRFKFDLLFDSMVIFLEECSAKSGSSYSCRIVCL